MPRKGQPGKVLTRAEKLKRFVVNPKSNCHEWTGAILTVGYGMFYERAFPGAGNVKQSRIYAHRASYELHKGPIPEGMLVRHSCHNRKCINPDHLSTGFIPDNIQDTIDAGRNAIPYGEKSGKCKYTDAEIEKVRELIAAGLSNKTIGKMLSMRWSYVYQIKTKQIRANGTGVRYGQA